MAYGNNRAGKQPRSHFMQAGGSIIKFRHPYLAGQVGGDSANIDEVDISAVCKLEGRYFEANPAQDSARQVVLIDGSTVTITNRLLNGVINMPVVKTTGLVSTGDFIACLHLIKSTGDNIGGLLFKTDFVDGQVITRCYYGIAIQRLPDDISVGNDVGEYPVSLLYSGWIEVTGKSVADKKKKIWAVGSQKGLEAYFAPYDLQNSDGETGTGDTYSSKAELADDVSADNNRPEVELSISDGKLLDKTDKAVNGITDASYIQPPATGD